MAVAVAVTLSEESDDDRPIRKSNYLPSRPTNTVAVVMNEQSSSDDTKARYSNKPIPVHNKNLRFPIDAYANQYAVCFMLPIQCGIDKNCNNPFFFHPRTAEQSNKESSETIAESGTL